MSFATGKPVVTDGPFTEAKEVLGDYWIVEVNSKEEGNRMGRKCPASENETIEIRQVRRCLTSPRRCNRLPPDSPEYGATREVNDPLTIVGRQLRLVTFIAGSCKARYMSWRKEDRRAERSYHHGNLKEALLRAALDLIAQGKPPASPLPTPRAWRA